MKTGEKITWISQAQGSDKKKTGTVICEIKAGESVMDKVPETAKKSHIKFDRDKSVYDRVLVSVAAGKCGDITHYYCPLLSVLKAQGLR